MPNLHHLINPKVTEKSAFMEEKNAFQQFLLLFLCIPFVISSYHARPVTTTTPKSLRFSMKPMHREHPNIKRTSSLSSDIRALGIPDSKSTVLLVNISIGNPPIPQLVVMDTGSSLLWIQCKACTQCFRQDSPMYNPSKSLTFRSLSCHSSLCFNHFVSQECSFSDSCRYSKGYYEGSSTNGTVGTEQIHFSTFDEGMASLNGLVFGCGLQNNVPMSNGESGILGLSANTMSLASQIGPSFSYCIGDLKDHSYPYNQLILGEKAKMEGYTTPLEVYDDLYYLTLEGISIGEERLEIDPVSFKRSWFGEGGVVIDSGSTFTELSEVGYKALKGRVVELIGSLLAMKADDEKLCYYGSVSRDMKGFPVVTLHLADGAEFVLDTDALFQESPNGDFFCMAVVQAKHVSIIGLMAQQYYNVGYDVAAKKLYLQRTECELLED